MKEAVIVGYQRSPFHFANKGALVKVRPDDLAATVKSVQKVALALQKAYAIDGLNIFQSNGAAAFQTIFHLHVHVFPRRDGDDVRLPWTPKVSDKDKLQRIADKVKAAL